MDFLILYSILLWVFGAAAYILGLLYRHWAAEMVGFYICALAFCLACFWLIGMGLGL